jgi:uncharacterized membrane protein
LIQIMSLAGWILIAIAAPHPPLVGGSIWWLVLATAACHVLGLAFVYRAFEVGTLSIVSPISSSFSVVTAVLAVATGERPPIMALGGTALLVSGIPLATRPSGTGDQAARTWKGVPEAIASALAFGAMFWIFCFFVEPKLGYSYPLAVLKLFAAGGSIVALRLSREAMPANGRLDLKTLALAGCAAAADTLAWLGYIAGAATAYVSVVTAVASLFSVVTIILAGAFLKERLTVPQACGVGIILLGVLLVSI